MWYPYAMRNNGDGSSDGSSDGDLRKVSLRFDGDTYDQLKAFCGQNGLTTGAIAQSFCEVMLLKWEEGGRQPLVTWDGSAERHLWRRVNQRAHEIVADRKARVT